MSERKMDTLAFEEANGVSPWLLMQRMRDCMRVDGYLAALYVLMTTWPGVPEFRQEYKLWNHARHYGMTATALRELLCTCGSDTAFHKPSCALPVRSSDADGE